MNPKLRCILIALSLLPTSLAVQAQSKIIPTAVDKIDINKYVGKWYEIAHLPMYFQRKCVSDTTATYNINSDKTVNVTNSCRIKTGELNVAEGTAYPQNTSNSKLKVSFLPNALH